MSTGRSAGDRIPALDPEDRRWSLWARIALFFAAVAVLVALVTIVSRDKYELGLNLVGVVSLALTAFAIYVAIRIFLRQAEQSSRDKGKHDELLRKIGHSSDRAADSARSAHVNSDEILRRLDAAQKSKTGERLTAERRTEALSAYGAVGVDGSPKVLWVDDNRDWIELERDALEAAGVATIWVPNTSRALELLEGNSFQVVITDMSRVEGPREGHVLLEAMRDRGSDVPVLVYSSSDSPAHVKEVLDHGGQGATNDPSRLFELVMNELAL